MKKGLVIVFLMLMAFGGLAMADSASDTAAGQIMISGISIEPEVFMQGDTGLITVEVINNGDSAVAIHRAELDSEGDIDVLNYGSYETAGTVGAGNTQKYSFTVVTDVPDGIYYPKFYLDFRDAGSYRYSIPVKVKDTGLAVTVKDMPDSFSSGKKDTITLIIGNPRENTVNGVTVVPSGTGIETNPKSIFIGTLDPDQSREVTFQVTPGSPEDLTFDVEFRNGVNSHVSSITVPLLFGEDKTRAEPVVNNIEVSGAGGTWTVSGDVTNAGLEDVKSMTVTVGNPAVPVDPNPVYVIGSLEPDDFSSFEVTFQATGSSVPLVLQYKDEDGNVYRESVTITLKSMASPGSGAAVPNGNVPPGGNRNPIGGFGSGFSKIPVTEIVAGIIIIVLAVIAWRKGLFTRLFAMIRKNKK
jgi:hypothetical protein